MRGLLTLTPVSGLIPCLLLGSEDLVMKAPYKERETKAADPIAKPLPMAAVVLPAASS